MPCVWPAMNQPSTPALPFIGTVKGHVRDCLEENAFLTEAPFISATLNPSHTVASLDPCLSALIRVGLTPGSP